MTCWQQEMKRIRAVGHQSQGSARSRDLEELEQICQKKKKKKL